jgi:hypothetical protein
LSMSDLETWHIGYRVVHTVLPLARKHSELIPTSIPVRSQVPSDLCHPPVFNRPLSPARRPIPSDSEAVVFSWKGRGLAEVSWGPFDSAFLAEAEGMLPEDPFLPGFLIHRPSRRAIRAGRKTGGWQAY